MSIGNKLSELRKNNNLTQAEFAEKYHVTRQTVSNWENDKHYPDLAVLKQISEEYGISFDALFKDDTKYIADMDQAKKKAFTLKKLLLGSVILVVLLIAGFIGTLWYAFQPTPMAARITTNTDTMMYVGIEGSNPSAAITKSFDGKAFQGFSDEKKLGLREETCGKLEGDIPYVDISKRKGSRVEFRFQNDGYENIQPKIDQVVLYTAAGMPVNPVLRDDKKVTYQYEDGVLSLHVSDFIRDEERTFYEGDADSDEEDENKKVWFCIFEIHYSYAGNEYVSLSAVSV